MCFHFRWRKLLLQICRADRRLPGVGVQGGRSHRPLTGRYWGDAFDWHLPPGDHLGGSGSALCIGSSGGSSGPITPWVVNAPLLLRPCHGGGGPVSPSWMTQDFPSSVCPEPFCVSVPVTLISCCGHREGLLGLESPSVWIWGGGWRWSAPLCPWAPAWPVVDGHRLHAIFPPANVIH